MEPFKLNPPPRYDEVYWEAMAKMDELARGQVELDHDAKKALYENRWDLYE